MPPHLPPIVIARLFFLSRLFSFEFFLLPPFHTFWVSLTRRHAKVKWVRRRRHRGSPMLRMGPPVCTRLWLDPGKIMFVFYSHAASDPPHPLSLLRTFGTKNTDGCSPQRGEGRRWKTYDCHPYYPPLLPPSCTNRVWCFQNLKLWKNFVRAAFFNRKTNPGKTLLMIIYKSKTYKTKCSWV